MNIDPDDPKLTAYVLGELDEPERAAVAAAVKQSLPCQFAVDEIRHTADWLATELQGEPCPQTVPFADGKWESKWAQRNVVSWWKAFAIAAPAAIAACFLFGFVLPGLVFSHKSKIQSLAQIGGQQPSGKTGDAANIVANDTTQLVNPPPQDVPSPASPPDAI